MRRRRRRIRRSRGPVLEYVRGVEEWKTGAPGVCDQKWFVYRLNPSGQKHDPPSRPLLPPTAEGPTAGTRP